MAYLSRRKKNTSPEVDNSPERWTIKPQANPEELSSNPRYELPQLETRESAVELPTGYGFHRGVGRAV
jgi:hypothetical protein